jgi:hypothetical protein
MPKKQFEDKGKSRFVAGTRHEDLSAIDNRRESERQSQEQ